MSADFTISTIRKNFSSFKIIGTDIHQKDWIYLSEKVDHFYQVPKASQQDFIIEIIQISEKHNVDLVLPLTDPEVDNFSAHRDLFEQKGIQIGISNKQSIGICRDKKRLYEVLRCNNHIKTVPVFTIDELQKDESKYPVIAKPRKGRSSEGIQYFSSYKALKCSNIKFSDYILQPVIEGDVYTVDVLRDHNNNIICIPRKELIRTANGAGLTVKVEVNNTLINLTKSLVEKINIIGCINIEFIFDGDYYYVMDLNPRFSAGISFSFLGGYDMVKNYVKMLAGDNIDRLETINTGIYSKKIRV